jgi:uncharacterized protein YdeI (YjbR/CyaY-like superfamily)
MKQLVENTAAYDFFNTLSYTNRKEYVRWITSAKMAETRDKRLNNAISLLLDKSPHR